MAMQFHNLNFTYELGIPNVVFNRVNKSIIKQATEAIDNRLADSPQKAVTS